MTGRVAAAYVHAECAAAQQTRPLPPLAPSLARARAAVGCVYLALMPAAAPAAAQQRPQAVTAFVDVAVVPMDRERVLPHQTVLVRGERIVALGPVRQVRVPAGATRVDGGGKFLLPGLADLHAHVGDAGLAADDSLVPGALFFFVAQGVTTIRDLWSGPAHLVLKDRVARGELLGPRIYAAWRPEECGERDSTDLATCIAAKQQAGYDFLKIEAGGANQQAFIDSVMTAARQVGLPVVGHVLDSIGLERTLALRYASIEHLTGYFEYLTRAPGAPVGTGIIPEHGSFADTLATWAQPAFHWDAAQLHAIAAATWRAGVWQTPTLRAGEIRVCPSGTATDRAGQVRCRWLQLRGQIAKALQEAGVGLLAGTDALPLQDGPAGRVPVVAELKALVAAGLTPYQALVTATRNPATFLGTLKQTGTIAAGKSADLVLLDGNPLTDIDQLVRPAGVVVRGRWLPRAELDAWLAQQHKVATPPVP